MAKRLAIAKLIINFDLINMILHQNYLFNKIVFTKFDKVRIIIVNFDQEFIVGCIIQVTGTVEFEDGLRTDVLLEGCWCPCGN